MSVTGQRVHSYRRRKPQKGVRRKTIPGAEAVRRARAKAKRKRKR